MTIVIRGTNPASLVDLTALSRAAKTGLPECLAANAMSESRDLSGLADQGS